MQKAAMLISNRACVMGGIGGMLLAGARYDAGGGAAAFRAAILLELLAPLGLLLPVLRGRRALL